MGKRFTVFLNFNELFGTMEKSIDVAEIRAKECYGQDCVDGEL